MGESVHVIIEEIKKGNKEKFLLIIDKMTPLINKYVRLLYKDEKEDMHSEFVLSLLEAINSMQYYKEDGQCVYFLSRALKNKFLEQYKKSKQHFDAEASVEDEFFTEISMDEPVYDDWLFHEDLKTMLLKTEGKQAVILRDIVFHEESDAVIAERHSVSRQYVNRVRRKFYNLLKENYYK